MSEQWYALWAKPHKERAVAKTLAAQDVDYFLPMVKVNPKNPRAAKFRPYFPSYLFIYVNLDERGANHFNWLPGTRGLVQFAGEPAIVPPNLIDQLQRQLAEIDRAGGLVFDGLEQGDMIRIKSGPFAGYEAMFDMRLAGKDRVQVLMSFLSNHPKKVMLDSADIEKI